MKKLTKISSGLLAAAFIAVLTPGCDGDVEEVQLSDEEFAAALEEAEYIELEAPTTRIQRVSDTEVTKKSTAEVWIEFEQDGQRAMAGGTISCEGSCSGNGCGVSGCDPKADGTCSGTVCKTSGEPCTDASCSKTSSSGTLNPTPVDPGPIGPSPFGPG